MTRQKETVVKVDMNYDAETTDALYNEITIVASCTIVLTLVFSRDWHEFITCTNSKLIDAFISRESLVQI